MAGNGRPHLDISSWLKNLDLAKYTSLFQKYGGVEDILHFTERDLKAHGMKNSSHRARMMTALVVLKDKYKKGNKMNKLGYPNRSTSLNNLVLQNRCSSTEQRSWPPSGQSSQIASEKSSRRTSISMEPFTGPDATPEEIRTALEWELSLDSGDLRSHAWYHGTIPRHRAEELLIRDGDFLIRDCISRPGDYVLTCLWSGTPLHFIINKIIHQPYTVYERIQYLFEDETFDAVPDLVTSYVGSKHPISLSSGAVICNPINRTMPLTYYMSRYGLDCQLNYVARALGCTQRKSPSPKCTLPERIPAVPGRNASPQPPDLPEKKRGSEVENPPPKPSRIPSKKYTEKPKINIRRLPSLEDNEDLVDRPNSEDYQFLTLSRVPSAKSLLERKTVDEDYNKAKRFVVPSSNSPSMFDLKHYKTPLLSSGNKPLDSSVMEKIRNMLTESGAKVLAAHLTKVDLELFRCVCREDLGCGVVSGLELLLLPQGKQLRKDILERFECMKLFIAITCLMCFSQNEIVEMINKWINVAIETNTALGNLFGFACIMNALSHPQISRLRNVWFSLRQQYTETAFIYETKLRPALKDMKKCMHNSQSSNVCIPYILSLVSIYDQTAETNPENGVVELLDSPGELSSVDYGLEILLNHLLYGRQLIQQFPSFGRTSETVISNMNYDQCYLDMFRTEFHLKLLWGSRGSTVEPVQRYEKFEQLLALISKRTEKS